MLELDRASLHASLVDPALRSVDFLAGVLARYPDAISFAPGAPHPDFLQDVDTGRYIDIYLDHLYDRHGVDRRQGRLLLHQYGPSRGLINDLIARALRLDLDVDVPAEAVVVTVGAQEAMLITLRTLFRTAGDLLAVVSPAYVGITGAARLLDIPVVPIAETGTRP